MQGAPGVKSTAARAAKAPGQGPQDGLSRDQARLRRLLSRVRAKPEDAAAKADYDRALAASIAARARRDANAPAPRFEDDLPVAREAVAILKAIAENQVVIVAGETGSGKTTQLPKLCLAAGRGRAGLIGCTQPRRIAARAVARRVAEELQSPLGGAVGYQVRFTEKVGEDTLHQVHDRRHPARRDPVRPFPVALRHHHHRRGARAQPQHRLPARLPAGSCCRSGPT